MRFYFSIQTFMQIFLVLVTLVLSGPQMTSFADSPPVPAGTSTSNSQQSSGQTGAQSPGIGGMLLPFALMFVVFYVLMIRPQQKKMREQENLLSGLKHGDEVISSSGILGKITGITEKVVTLEIADNVRIKMLKSQISQVVRGQVKELS